MLYDTGAPTIEVRIYDHSQLLMRELCESEEDVGCVVERWSDVANLFVVADDVSSRHGPDDILGPDVLLTDVDEGQPLATRSLPGQGTE
jgi:hypothetical protein